jgi:malonyl-CoA/methylmalonyl-CoA synthetase
MNTLLSNFKNELFLNKTAIISNGSRFSYLDLNFAANNFAQLLLENEADLNEKRVAFLVEPGFKYVMTLWGIWLAGGVAVPLCTSHPFDSLKYTIDDSQAEIIVVSPEYENILKEYAQKIGKRFIVLSENISHLKLNLPEIEANRRAMILYTSGTTNLPKGVVTTHANIYEQVSALVKSWEYSPEDSILCILPLHHVHGIINVVSCTLFAGGTVEFQPNFSSAAVFNWMKNIAQNKLQGVFMAVPTIYFKLLAFFETLSIDHQNELIACMKTFRLMVSGSAALPVSVMEKWEKISGHRLLERYGMTEIAMAISNPYRGERRAGHIGQALPGVTVRLVDENNTETTSNEPGEIQIKGKNVFLEYWGKKQATIDTFTTDGWFKTGDIAILENGFYKILGRNSVDIIKSGGYKISALEIEEILRTHTEIIDCSVVGIDNEEWGEIVVAAILTDSNNLNINDLNNWIREKLPAYKVPRQYKIIDELPKNAMGKVTKNDLKKLFI